MHVYQDSSSHRSVYNKEHSLKAYGINSKTIIVCKIIKAYLDLQEGKPTKFERWQITV